jgi:hypothetical protein
VLVEGRPRLLKDAADLADAVLMAYLPGPEVQITALISES